MHKGLEGCTETLLGHGGHEAGGHHGGVVVAAGFVGLAAVVGVTGVGVVLAGGGGYG